VEDTKEIVVGDYNVNDPFVPGTFHIFDTVNPLLLRAIIDELGLGYGLDPDTDPITITKNILWPPSSALMFARLALGRQSVSPPGHDINGFNAALGATVSVGGVEKRRRDVARFTCTVFATHWYAHVRDDAESLQDVNDVIELTPARLCVGQLSSRLSEDYFKNARGGRCKTEGSLCTVHADCATGDVCINPSGNPGAGVCVSNTTAGTPCTANADCATGEKCNPWITKVMLEDDLAECSGGVSDGTYDIYLHFDPVPESYPDPNDLKVVPLQVVSGIPIWVDGEESCEGLDVCEGDLNADQNVDANDVTIFLEDFGRNTFNNQCPACANGW
jgi:hypothetical protein